MESLTFHRSHASSSAHKRLFWGWHFGTTLLRPRSSRVLVNCLSSRSKKRRGNLRYSGKIPCSISTCSLDRAQRRRASRSVAKSLYQPARSVRECWSSVSLLAWHSLPGPIPLGEVTRRRWTVAVSRSIKALVDQA